MKLRSLINIDVKHYYSSGLCANIKTYHFTLITHTTHYAIVIHCETWILYWACCHFDLWVRTVLGNLFENVYQIHKMNFDKNTASPWYFQVLFEFLSLKYRLWWKIDHFFDYIVRLILWCCQFRFFR